MRGPRRWPAKLAKDWAALLPLGLLVLIGLGAGGFGIANEKKWGYAIAVAAAVFQIAVFVLYGGLGALRPEHDARSRRG